MSGLTARAPASYPAWKRRIRSPSRPPTKPMWPLSDLRAAAAPTRNEPWCSAKTRLETFGASTTESTMPKLVSGHSAATAVSGSVNRNPTASTGL